jgi:cobalt-zinc-cadmium efflux system outer membrane protein
MALSAAASTAAQEVLTLESALQRARERAPFVLAARARIDEARARRAGAAVRLRENPTLAAAAGPRDGPEGDTVDVELGFEQLFETGGQRDARISAADAGIELERASSEVTLRRHLREVGFAFLRGLAARDRLSVSSTTSDVAAGLQSATERRYELGDVAALDLNLARMAAARARAELSEASAEKVSSEGRLRALLAIPKETALLLEGDLRAHGRVDANEVLSLASELPELLVLGAEIRQADAEARLGRAERRPDIGLGLELEREEGDRVVRFGGLLRLPLFQRGEARRAEAEARGRRLGIELEGARSAFDNELKTAFGVYLARAEAAETMLTSALPAAEDNDNLAARSHEAGEIGLLELLLLRRAALETRLSTIDHLLEAALSAVELEILAGVVR